MDIIMPQLGETVAEGEILMWHKAEGETVNKGDVLFEISTDKVAMEVPAMENGVLSKIIADVGEVIAVGEPVAVLAVEGEEAEPEPVSSKAPEQISPASEPITAPVAVSNEKLEGHGLLSPAVKYLTRRHQLDLGEIEGTGQNGRITKRNVLDFLEKSVARCAEQTELDEEALALMSPSVRRLVTEHDIDINQIEGSGKHGRITKEDVLAIWNPKRLLHLLSNL